MSWWRRKDRRSHTRKTGKRSSITDSVLEVGDGVLDMGGAVVEAVGDGAGAALEGMGGCAEGCGGCATAIVIGIPLGAIALWQGLSLLA